MTPRVFPPISPEERRENPRKGGRYAQSPEGLATRLARNCHSLDEDQQTYIRRVLRPYLLDRRTPAK